MCASQIASEHNDAVYNSKHSYVQAEKARVHNIGTMFTTLESTGIVRTTPQGFQLSADYNEKDNLSA
eukprot:12277947-Karenia_brevis.AAC.1